MAEDYGIPHGDFHAGHAPQNGKPDDIMKCHS